MKLILDIDSKIEFYLLLFINKDNHNKNLKRGKSAEETIKQNW